MPIFLVTDDNIEFAKAEVRQAWPDVRTSHRLEAFAAALNFRTYASMLAVSKQVVAFPSIASLVQDRFSSRLAQLGYLAVDESALSRIPRSTAVPLLPWVEFKSGDRASNERWFRECKRRDIPNIRIEMRTKYAELHWDCISQDSRHDDSRDADLSRAMFACFQARSYPGPGRPIYQGSAIVGSIERLLPEVARDIADDYFKFLMKPIKETPAAKVA